LFSEEAPEGEGGIAELWGSHETEKGDHFKIVKGGAGGKHILRGKGGESRMFEKKGERGTWQMKFGNAEKKGRLRKVALCKKNTWEVEVIQQDRRERIEKERGRHQEDLRASVKFRAREGSYHNPT